MAFWPSSLSWLAAYQRALSWFPIKLPKTVVSWSAFEFSTSRNHVEDVYYRP